MHLSHLIISFMQWLKRTSILRNAGLQKLQRCGALKYQGGSWPSYIKRWRIWSRVWRLSTDFWFYIRDEKKTLFVVSGGLFLKSVETLDKFLTTLHVTEVCERYFVCSVAVFNHYAGKHVGILDSPLLSDFFGPQKCLWPQSVSPKIDELSYFSLYTGNKI